MISDDFQHFFNRYKLFFQNAVYFVKDHNIKLVALDYFFCMLPSLHRCILLFNVRLENKTSCPVCELLKMLLLFLQRVNSKLVYCKPELLRAVNLSCVAALEKLDHMDT